MSSLLRDAIVDAKALRESALKNAETSIIEKYSSEVKDTLDKLLEQDEMGAETEEQNTSKDIVDNVPLAATDNLSEEEGEIPNNMTEEGDEVSISVDLDALQEAVAALESELNEESEDEINENDDEIDLTEEGLIDAIAEILAEDDEELEERRGRGRNDRHIRGNPDPRLREEEEVNEEEEIEEATTAGAAATAADTEQMKALDGDNKDTDSDDEEDAVNAGTMSGSTNEDLDTDALVDAIMEKLTVDMGADLAGWAGRSSDDMKYQIEKEMAHRRSTDVEEDMETLKKAQEELVFENKQLTEKLSKYEGVLGELQENLQDVNLSNARLLYTNRVLRNTSLNERQKEKIVEAISNAGSVTEARTIFETLQSAVEAKPKRSPQSLSEAIGNKRSSVIRATRQESTNSDPFQERMKRLAGIK